MIAGAVENPSRLLPLLLMGLVVSSIEIDRLAEESLYVVELPTDRISYSSCNVVKPPEDISLESVGFPGKKRSSSINCIYDDEDRKRLGIIEYDPKWLTSKAPPGLSTRLHSSNKGSH